MKIEITGHVHMDVHVWTTLKGIGGAKDGNGHWDDGGNYWADIE